MTQTLRKTFLAGAIAALLGAPVFVVAEEVNLDTAQAADPSQVVQQWRDATTHRTVTGESADQPESSAQPEDKGPDLQEDTPSPLEEPVGYPTEEYTKDRAPQRGAGPHAADRTTGFPGARPHRIQDRPGQVQPGMPTRPGEEQEYLRSKYLSSLAQDHFLADDLIGQPVQRRKGMGWGDAMIPSGAGRPMQRNVQQPWPEARPGTGSGADEGLKVGTVGGIILDRRGQVVGLVISREGAGGEVALSWDVIDMQRNPEDRASWIVYADVDKESLDDAREFRKDVIDARYRTKR